MNEKEQVFCDKSKLIKTLFLENVEEGKKLDQIRPFYKELKYIGQHYLVRSLANPIIYRHFTIANVMSPEIYKEIISCMSSQEIIKDGRLVKVLDSEPTHRVPFTIKIYDSGNLGLSFRFFEEPQTSLYEI